MCSRLYWVRMHTLQHEAGVTGDAQCIKPPTPPPYTRTCTHPTRIVPDCCRHALLETRHPAAAAAALHARSFSLPAGPTLFPTNRAADSRRWRTDQRSRAAAAAGYGGGGCPPCPSSAGAGSAATPACLSSARCIADSAAAAASGCRRREKRGGGTDAANTAADATAGVHRAWCVACRGVTTG